MTNNQNKILMAAVGDIGLIGDVRKNINKYNVDFPFAKVKSGFQSADLVFGNLEMPFCSEAPKHSEKKSSEFWADPNTASALLKAGFTIVSFANNHTLEHGQQGIGTTLSLLDDMGIHCVGAGIDLNASRRLVSISKNDIKVGFLAYAKSDECASATQAGPAPLNEVYIIEDILKARQEVDVIVVSLHFGMIYMDYPNDEGKALCRRIIDAGADIILGHHPHVLQGFEEYKGGLIAYSLGEFIFDPKGGLWYAELGREKRKESVILQVELDGSGYRGHSFLPTYANDLCQPELAEGILGERITNRVIKISEELKNMTPAKFYEYAGKRMVKYELNAFLYHLKRFHVFYFIEKLKKVRTRHFKLLIGFLRKKLSSA